MRRLFRLGILTAIICLLSAQSGFAVFAPPLTGRVAPGEVKILTKDYDYLISGDYVIGGTLIIEPGTKVYFLPNSRLIDSVGGRIIADGMAKATYNANPLVRFVDGEDYALDPISNQGSRTNPESYYGYADPAYFLYKHDLADTDETYEDERTVVVDTDRDPTVHPTKYDHIFNVVVDTNTRQIENLNLMTDYDALDHKVVISFEEALLWKIARFENDPGGDFNYNKFPWQRGGDQLGGLDDGEIQFIGQPVDNFSREWGHIVVLPGARAAFFRNCSFDGLRKDTTVGRKPFLDTRPEAPAWHAQINDKLIMGQNGAGGALTTFSARTWLLDCSFTNNMARHRGGALNILEAPEGYPVANANLGFYPANKNPNITEKDRNISSVIRDNPVQRIDNIDESAAEPLSCFDRQAFDDGRLALYLGRMRNLSFDGNYVRLTNYGRELVGNPPVEITRDLLNEPATYPQKHGNDASGGAIYIAGNPSDNAAKIEVGLGVNNSIMVEGNLVEFDDEDTFECVNNRAENYQESLRSDGARGGAIYVGKFTSMIVAGNVSHNETFTKYLLDKLAGTYSRGGAIFTENTLGRLQVRGGPARNDIGNATMFEENEAGAGGAIYVDGNTDPTMSPIIGGSDRFVETRDYGYNIVFKNNIAHSYGGALYSRRNFTITGSGGVVAEELIGYGGEYPVRFLQNKAGFSGGAITANLPNSAPMPPARQKTLQIVRAEFEGNIVGANIADEFKTEIRGGGAIYAVNADLNVVKGVQFLENTVYNGNGGAIAMVHPYNSSKRFFLSDLDMVRYDAEGVAFDYESVNSVFTSGYYEDDNPYIPDDEEVPYPADARMLTRFVNNKIEVDEDILDSQSGSGTTQISGDPENVNTLNAVYFHDQYNGFAVGNFGTIVKVSLGGIDWEYKNYPGRLNLNDVYFTDPGNGYAVGDDGVILWTNSNGDMWYTMRRTDDGLALWAITFIGADAYVVGDNGAILKSTDGFNTWNELNSGVNMDLYDVYFTDGNTGFAVGERGTFLRTDNAGATWQTVNINTINELNGVYFTDNETGYVVGGEGLVMKTEDGGDSWDVIYSDVSKYFNFMRFTDAETGYVVGADGFMMKTEDGGDSWDELDLNTERDLMDVHFPTTQIGYAVGDSMLIKKTTDAGASWTNVTIPESKVVDIVRYNKDAGLAENGVGLGGALFVLDSVTVNRIGRRDTVNFNRVRIENNMAYTGAAVYSDNYDLKLLFNRSLITRNVAYSDIGMMQNVITGPVQRDGQGNTVQNFASSDLAGAILYGEVQGPLPSAMFSEAANSIYDNEARFLVRLPDAPNSKGVLAGEAGIGFGGTDTLRGNYWGGKDRGFYWGRTEANVTLQIENNFGYTGAKIETFFIDTDGETHLPFVRPATSDPREQGPFESEWNDEYTYRPIPLVNGVSENEVGDLSIPEKLLMSGNVYDIYDKGTDIKVADYKHRRMSPIEDFAVGLPVAIDRFEEEGLPSYGKYVKRWLKDPFDAEEYSYVAAIQGEFTPDKDGRFYHPIGYPLYLETKVDYDGTAEIANHDPYAVNETVFFIVNTTTNDYVRAVLKQVSEDAPHREIFRGRIELVPDQTYRNAQTRRTNEGLKTVPASDFNTFLRNLRHNPYKEDSSALPGRRYHAHEDELARVPDLFINRPDLPPSNNDTVTYYAGERFRALPVNVGDTVRIVSRTVLWREGVEEAYNDGLEFRIIGSTDPPTFTGDVVSLQTDTITQIRASEYPWKRDNLAPDGTADPIPDTLKLVELLNSIRVTEDRPYPVPRGVYSGMEVENGQGRDSLITITAIDSNEYYDPRSIENPEEFPRLEYSYYVDPNSGLSRWLLVDTIPAEISGDPQEMYDALGYMMFRGRPLNPYIVPGGEDVYISVRNFPPGVRTIDVLKQMGWRDPDSLDKFIELFPPYLHAPEYDLGEGMLRARFMQQDTINNGFMYEADYQFKIFVIDSIPVFLEPDDLGETWDDDMIQIQPCRECEPIDHFQYEASVYTCDRTDEGKLKANLTDSLRFKVDFNTDDEIEDRTAGDTWDFRYGKTAYGFVNVAVRGRADNPGDEYNEEVVIDTTTYDSDMDGDEDDVVIKQVRPKWMASEYLYRYEDSGIPDEYLIDLRSKGQINIRIGKDEAIQLLMPDEQINGALNTDTVFAVIVNDGHGGVNMTHQDVFVNVAPEIITQTLPNAKEDWPYNPQLLDSSKRIKVFDPNFGQTHKWRLVYAPEGNVPKDPCFPEAGAWDLSNASTPRWLKINEESGLLYGTPSVDDAPRTDKVSVLVEDEDGLTVYKELNITVDSTNHAPKITGAPPVICVDLGSEYIDTLLVIDRDLLRGEEEGDPSEVLNVRVVQPASGMQVTPSTIEGPRDTDTIPVMIHTDNFQVTPDADGKATIIIEVTDASGVVATYRYRINISLETDFVCPILVSNSRGAVETLRFGTGSQATTGDGETGVAPDTVGNLDIDYCEYELPPLPPEDVFDARWTVPLKNGILRNIYPTAAENIPGQRIYRAKIQPGGEDGETSPMYPLKISWELSDVPAADDRSRNPAGSGWWIKDAISTGQYFDYNMNTGSGRNSAGIAVTTDAGRMTITVLSNIITDFIIVQDLTSDVENAYAGLPSEVAITSVNPNPVTGETEISIALPNYSEIDLEIYDALGSKVATVAKGSFSAGVHTLRWSNDKLSSGSYTVRLIDGENVANYPIVIVK